VRISVPVIAPSGSRGDAASDSPPAITDSRGCESLCFTLKDRLRAGVSERSIAALQLYEGRSRIRGVGGPRCLMILSVRSDPMHSKNPPRGAPVSERWSDIPGSLDH
jgi:hypothetical protein